jgi:predicted ATP-dependent endonuclease of OLD family
MKERISKIKIEGAYGIQEIQLEPKSITEITGATGTGKTSVLDSLKLILTNKSARTRFIKNG